jgi:hypothetical protein
MEPIWERDSVDLMIEKIEIFQDQLKQLYEKWEIENNFSWGSTRIIKDGDSYRLQRSNFSRAEYLKRQLTTAIWKEDFEKAKIVNDEIIEKKRDVISQTEINETIAGIFNRLD